MTDQLCAAGFLYSAKEPAGLSGLKNTQRKCPTPSVNLIAVQTSRGHTRGPQCLVVVGGGSTFQSGCVFVPLKLDATTTDEFSKFD